MLHIGLWSFGLSLSAASVSRCSFGRREDRPPSPAVHANDATLTMAYYSQALLAAAAAAIRTPPIDPSAAIVVDHCISNSCQ